MDFKPAFSPEIASAVKDIGSADLMVGIPAYNNESTIAHVMQAAAEGLATFFPHMSSVVFVCEGGSLDETRRVAGATNVDLSVRKLVGTYRGESGKGNALRAVFQAVMELGVQGCALMDGDLRSVNPEWVNNLLGPIVQEEYDFIAPYYRRYKYDGTITNTLVYPVMTSLFGKRIRQPIGGDFGISGDFIKQLSHQDVWDKYVGQFGIDVWMTISAITSGVRICQANLGAKIHNAKDPAFSLGPMYVQVLSTLFRSMPRFEEFWTGVANFEDVCLKGTAVPWEPEPIPISVTRLVEEFLTGMKHFGSIYREIFEDDNYRRLENVANSFGCDPESSREFFFPTDLWARLVYDLAVTFNCWKVNTHKLIDLSSLLYYGEVASLANRTYDLSYEDAEQVIEDGVRVFEREKDYLMTRWNKACKEEACPV